jgi:hypothetical protein
MAAFLKMSILDNCHKPLSDKELNIISQRNKMAMWPFNFTEKQNCHMETYYCMNE